MQPTSPFHATYLFPAIVLLLIAQPVLASFVAGPREVLEVPLAATLVAAVISLDRSGKWSRLAAGIGLVFLAAWGLRVLSPGSALSLSGGGGALILLSLLAVFVGIRSLLESSRITARTLLTATSVYLLIGITFAMIYVLIYSLEPGWYRGVGARGKSAETAELIYFSLGTLTTTAYGDILPAHPVTRLLSNIEAVVGQLYMAVLVAMLVGGYAATRAQESAPRAPPDV